MPNKLLKPTYNLDTEALVADITAVIETLGTASKKNREDLDAEIKAIREALELLKQEIRDGNSQEVQVIKGDVETRLNRVISETLDYIKRLGDEQKNSLNFLRDKAASLRHGRDGKDGKAGEPGKDGGPDSPIEIRDKLEVLEGDQRLSIDAIKDLRKELERVNNLGGRGGGVIGHLQRFSDIMLVPSGDIDGANATYSFGGQKPTVVVVNGASYREGHGWTFTSSNVVLDFAPATGSDIYGIQ